MMVVKTEIYLHSQVLFFRHICIVFCLDFPLHASLSFKPFLFLIQ